MHGVVPTLTIGRFGTAPVRLHLSALVIPVVFGALIALWPRPAGGAALGVIAALGCLASLQVRELARAVYGRAAGLRVTAIVINFTGGEAEFDRLPQSACSAVGRSLTRPAVGIVLGAILLGAALLVPTGPLGFTLYILGSANVGGAVFSLLPAGSLDGGRVLQTVVAAKTGSLSRGAVTAGRVGQVVAILMLVGGLVLGLHLGAHSGPVFTVLVGLAAWMTWLDGSKTLARGRASAPWDTFVIGDALRPVTIATMDTPLRDVPEGPENLVVLDERNEPFALVPRTSLDSVRRQPSFADAVVRDVPDDAVTVRAAVLTTSSGQSLTLVYNTIQQTDAEYVIIVALDGRVIGEVDAVQASALVHGAPEAS